MKPRTGRRGVCVMLAIALIGCGRRDRVADDSVRADLARASETTMAPNAPRIVPYDPARRSAPRPAPAPGTTAAVPSSPARAGTPFVRAPAAEPSPDSLGDPAAIVRAYYAAIRAHDFLRAYRMWAASGQTGGRSYAQFEAGFDSTESVDAKVDAPSREEGAAGSRYVMVPVDISSRLRNGTPQRFTGSYTLRRVVVPGASAAQRRWHLYAANVRQVR